ncbi:MAG: hypoxanthine-guanine phosphoribosyltransferase [Candidatus Protistobacter heckmanni]|nr:hypoxanthine-guanine phosphoribosyltransferase [Candidatus Protistobacter heckmanni]
MSPARKAASLLANSREIVSAEQIASGVAAMAWQIRARLSEGFPLVLAILGGASVFTGMLLLKLDFPLEFDYLQLSGYQDGGGMRWRVAPRSAVAGRTVLVIDDLMDDGITMAAIRERILDMGAKDFLCAVLCEKDGKPETSSASKQASKPIVPDFRGFMVSDAHVFGCGMDVEGLWRNLPSIRAID